jgi:eukaryotic-like serine/threonine-protein kinase
MTERFEIEGDVGSGGMANVVRAHDTDLGRKVAIKRLHRHIAAEPAAAARFKREALSAAALSHPGIVTVFDVGEDDDGPFIVMEFVDGETLTALMSREGPLTPETAAGVTLQVSRALDHAHQRGVIHRDVKPGNILLDADGAAKLADFGIATSLAGDARFTDADLVLGTIAYLAPERIAGEQATPASDIYSLGVVLYEMLTGRMPFDADTPGAMIAAQQHGRFDPPGDVVDVPAGLEAIVLQALETDPAARFESAAALAERLETWIDDPVTADAVARSDASETMPLVVPAPVVAPPTRPLAAAHETGVLAAAPTPPHGPPSSRNPWLPLFAGIALGALLVLLVTQLGAPDAALGGATTTEAAGADDDAGGDASDDTTTTTQASEETTTTEPEVTTTVSVEQAFVDLGALLSDGRSAGSIAPPAFNALSRLAGEAAEEWRDDDPEDAAEALAEFDLQAIDEFLRGRISSLSTLVDLLVQTQLIREVADLPEYEIEGRGPGRSGG